jgi:hypothetical protein
MEEIPQDFTSRRKSRCKARLAVDRYQYAPGTAYRYKSRQCPRVALPDSNLCRICTKNEQKYMEGKVGTWNGMFGGPLPPESHIETSEWNVALREREARRGPRVTAKRRVVSAPSSGTSSTNKSYTSNSSGRSSNTRRSTSSRRSTSIRRRTTSKAPSDRVIYRRASRAASASPPRPTAITYRPATPVNVNRMMNTTRRRALRQRILTDLISSRSMRSSPSAVVSMAPPANSQRPSPTLSPIINPVAASSPAMSAPVTAASAAGTPASNYSFGSFGNLALE